MASIVLVGTVAEIKPVTCYVDGDEVEGYDLTINQPEYDAFCKAKNFKYWPPKVRFTARRIGEEVPDVGQRVVALVSTSVREKDGKLYINLNGRSLALAK